jgi:hypothetical protein
MSSNATKSRWVKAEVHWAMEHRSGHVVPVLIGDCEPVEFHLGMPLIQYIDYRVPSDESRRRLLNAVLGHPNARPPVSNQPTGKESLVRLPIAHFHCGPRVPPEYFIGREDELQEATQLIFGGQSFLVVGEPRAGKTSFLRKLMNVVPGQSNNHLLVGYINLQQCSCLTTETFLEHTILNIVGEMARGIFGCRYSDLKRADPATMNPSLEHDEAFRAFVAIFHHISERTHKRADAAPEPLLVHDFIHYARELLDISAEKRRGHFVMLYDEANRLPSSISSEMLISISEALSHTGLVGGYAASPEMVEHFHPIESLFGNQLELGPFKSIEEMWRLLARYYFDDAERMADLPIQLEAANSIWERSRGIPFLIQLLADRSFRVAARRQGDYLTSRDVEQAHAELLKERPRTFSEK